MEAVSQEVSVAVNGFMIEGIHVPFTNLRKDLEEDTPNNTFGTAFRMLLQPSVPATDHELSIGDKNTVRSAAIQPFNDRFV